MHGTRKARAFERAIGLIAVTMLTASAAACGSGGDGDADSGDEPVTMTIWVNSADRDAEKNLYAAYEEATGNKLEVISIPAAGYEDALMTRWATGERPDLMEWHPEPAFMAGLNPTENLVPLDGMEYIAKSGDLYQDNGNWDGKVYATILAAPGLFGMYYNKAVLAEAGIEAPTNYAELKAACETLKTAAPDVTPIFQAGGSKWPLTALPFNLMGGNYDYALKIAYNEAKFGQEGSPFLAALEKFKELQDAGCYNADINTATEEDSIDALYTGQAAILFQSSGEIPLFASAAGDDEAAMSEAVGWGAVGETEAWALTQPSPQGSYMVPKTGDSAKESAAKGFIEFATGDYYQTYVNELK
ncbi:MAG: extracellular solute-binding protein, partial [Propionibacteriaceae bacterium]|nr:extracellular solute-binding protein [Propionibacteriaceae bacterium]